VNALGVSEAEVVVQGDRNIVVSLAGKAEDQLKDLSQAAQMRFRLVIGATGDVAATALNPPSRRRGASAAARRKPSTSASAPAANAARPRHGGQGGGEVVKAPSPSATPTPSADARPRRPPAVPAEEQVSVAERAEEGGRGRLGRRREADRPGRPLHRHQGRPAVRELREALRRRGQRADPADAVQRADDRLPAARQPARTARSTTCQAGHGLLPGRQGPAGQGAGRR
jgi:hypothetical protein